MITNQEINCFPSVHVVLLSIFAIIKEPPAITFNYIIDISFSSLYSLKNWAEILDFCEQTLPRVSFLRQCEPRASLSFNYRLQRLVPWESQQMENRDDCGTFGTPPSDFNLWGEGKECSNPRFSTSIWIPNCSEEAITAEDVTKPTVH